MKNIKNLIALIVIISFFIAGCSNAIESEEQNVEGKNIEVQQNIEVKKRIGNENKYEIYKEITNNEQVQKVKEILDDIDWENAKAEMVRPPDYKFSFPNPEAKVVLYSLWISPNNGTVELVISASSKYIQLDKNKSAELIEILTGEKLSDLKESQIVI